MEKSEDRVDDGKKLVVGWEILCQGHSSKLNGIQYESGIQYETSRMKIPGGYLVSNSTRCDQGVSESMCFVPNQYWYDNFIGIQST